MTNLPDPLLHTLPWNAASQHPIWPVTCLSLRRNISGYVFPSKISTPQSTELFARMKTALLKTEPTLTYLDAKQLGAAEREFLYEHFLSQDTWQSSATEQGFLLNPNARFLAMLGGSDHLLLQWIDYDHACQQSWESLHKIDTTLSQELPYAHSPRFGYMTSDPKCSGTALTIFCYLHLPALIRSEKLLSNLAILQHRNIEFSSLSGNREEFIGDFLLLKNRCTLGIQEKEILQDLKESAEALIAQEEMVRQGWKKTLPSELKDAISRSYGLLSNAYSLQTKEALSLGSLIKLGIYLDQIRGMEDKDINELLFRCRRAHMTQLASHSPEKMDLAQMRAKVFREKLQNAKPA